MDANRHECCRGGCVNCLSWCPPRRAPQHTAQGAHPPRCWIRRSWRNGLPGSHPKSVHDHQHVRRRRIRRLADGLLCSVWPRRFYRTPGARGIFVERLYQARMVSGFAEVSRGDASDLDGQARGRASGSERVKCLTIFYRIYGARRSVSVSV
jgi:hypothetical protein